jgi:hypothetical protein
MRLKGFSVRRIASDFAKSKCLLWAIASDNDWDYLRTSAARFLDLREALRANLLEHFCCRFGTCQLGREQLPGIAFLQHR